MIYLTYNDQPSGIYTSQVTDVVNYLNEFSEEKVQLVALISLRHFRANKNRIKQHCPNALVLPMFPGAASWKLNLLTLQFVFLFKKPDAIMARGAFAANLAIKLKQRGFAKRVVFDARGAYAAELNEYNVVNDAGLKRDIAHLEKQALLLSDKQLAVSHALVQYWKEHYQFEATQSVIIPCTLSRLFEFSLPEASAIEALRASMNYSAQDIIYLYSGSSAGWQSFALIDEQMYALMSSNANVRLIVLAHQFDPKYKVCQTFPERIQVMHVAQEKVRDFLLISDVGILFREQSVTNRVASPVKFAEYLSGGLKVMISERLGDYSEFSKTHALLSTHAERTSYTEKLRVHQLSQDLFLKRNYHPSYQYLLQSN